MPKQIAVAAPVSVLGPAAYSYSTLGVTRCFYADYNQSRSFALTSHATQPYTSAARFHPACGPGVRAAWSRAIFHPTEFIGGTRRSTRADSKLAPCMVRPNLFSGD
jgi:hypothetical protein